MEALPPLVVALPLTGALALLGLGRVLGRAVIDTAAGLTALATAALAAVLAWHTLDRPLVAWMGGWAPRGGEAIGIPLVADAASAGLATLAALLVAAALLFAWRHFWEAGDLFQVLLLLLLGGLMGLLFTADLFNLFVFLELTSVPAYALTAYQVRHRGPLQSAVNLAVTSSFGSLLFLLGVGLVYARAGTLALAGIGRRLDAPADALVAGAFGLLLAGFLVKAGAVPFHFAHADAHTVAPTSALVVFSGAMLPLGVYGLVRVWRIAFSAALPAGGAVAGVLLAGGAATAVVGAAMCWRQTHLKRLLAFSTISHVGLLVAAAGIANEEALAGMALYLVGHAGAEGALFMAAGILLFHRETLEVGELHGRGRDRPWLAAAFSTAALALAGAPPFAAFYGKSAIEEAAATAGLWWVEWVFVGASGVTAGAALRTGARVFLGWGEPAGTAAKAPRKTRAGADEGRSSTPQVMSLALAVLLALALAAATAPARRWAQAAGGALADGGAHAAAVLDGEASTPRTAPRPPHATKPALRGAGAALTLALGLAALGLRVLPGSDEARRSRRGAESWLEAAHTGHVGDYLAWLVGGFAACCAVLLLT